MTSEQEFSKNDYMALHDRCAVCHWPARRQGRWLELHHIVGGPGRKDVPENWIALCCRCHRAVHDKLPDVGELPKGAVVSAKWEEDGEFDLAILAKLKRRHALPYDPEPVPDVFLSERHRNGGFSWPG